LITASRGRPATDGPTKGKAVPSLHPETAYSRQVYRNTKDT